MTHFDLGVAMAVAFAGLGALVLVALSSLGGLLRDCLTILRRIDARTAREDDEGTSP